MIESALNGLWLGFCVAAPIGPIGMLVLKQSLQRGAAAGFACGFGAAVADLIYGALAVAGVRMASGYERQTATIGGVLLLWLAWRSWRERPAADAAAARGGRILSGTLTTMLLTLSNPLTVLMFAALVAGVGAAAPAWFVGGLFCGSLIWWATLSIAAGWLSRVMQVRAVVLSRITALTLAGFGGWEIVIHGLRYK